MPADNKQSFFAHVASRVKKAFQGAAGEQKEEEKETEEETLQPDKADEPEQEKEVPEVNLDTDPEELQEFRPKQTGEDGKPDDVDSVKTNGGVVLQKKDVQKTKPKKEDGAAKEDSRENEEKPDRNVPA